MATANLGRVGFVNKGTYSGATAYKVNDVVTYNTGTYACIQANTGQAPTNTSYWQNWVSDNAVHKTGNETIAGVKTFASSPLLPVPTLANQAISMGNILEKTGVGIGYGTGSGGTVTQLTSKGTAVALNKPSGRIVTHNASLAAGATVMFQVSNSLILTTDMIDVILVDNSSYDVKTGWNTNGAFVVKITNTTGSPLSEVLNIHFNVTKGSIN